MSLTAAQRLLNEAYKTVYAGPAGAVVLDDMLTFIRSAPSPKDVTAFELHAHCLSRMSLARRAKLLSEPQPKRGLVENLNG